MVLIPLLEFRRLLSEGIRPIVRVSAAQEIRTMDELASCIAQRNQISRRTIWNWLALLDRGGFAALACRQRSDKGRSRFFSARPAVAAYVLREFFLHRTAKSIHKELRLGGEKLSYNLLCSYLKPFRSSL
jgi:hypothetical protein